MRKGLALVMLAGGGAFVYFAFVIAGEEILPAWSRGSWSLSTTSTILNRDWAGNELYALLGLYLAAAVMLFAGAGWLLRGRQ